MSIVRWGFVALLVGVCAGPGLVQAATPLDGTKWKVTLTPDAAAKKAGEKTSKDSLIFKAGQMTSTACVKYGFASSSYTAEGSTFKAEQMSAKEGQMSWSGQAAGEAISGTTTWTKKNGQQLHYEFSGKKAKSS